MPARALLYNFIHWPHSGGAERSKDQGFLIELCVLLAILRPNPAVSGKAKSPASSPPVLSKDEELISYLEEPG